MRPVHHVVPQPARLVAVTPESADTRTFVLALDGVAAPFDAARPGQFAMLSVLGHGEAAFTLAALPESGGHPGHVTFTVRRIGALTTALFALPLGARLGVRGPFGRGFPDVGASVPAVYVAGGCGLAALRPAIDAHLAHRTPRTPTAILYGARLPETRILRASLAAWGGMPAVTLVECVDHPDAAWTGRRGTVATFVAEAVRACGAQRALLCGPSGMLAATACRLRDAGLPPGAIHVALERQMKCGYGACGHCYVNDRYVCTDGPVFSLAELERLPDAFGIPADVGNAP